MRLQGPKPEEQTSAPELPDSEERAEALRVMKRTDEWLRAVMNDADRVFKPKPPTQRRRRWEIRGGA